MDPSHEPEMQINYVHANNSSFYKITALGSVLQDKFPQTACKRKMIKKTTFNHIGLVLRNYNR
jgi:hypothetical protein